ETGLTIHDDVAVTGSVTDDLSGVEKLQEQMDSGSSQTVVLDSAGEFSIPTDLPTDGSADGPHTVHLIATDRAGNVTNAIDSFTLDTSGVNRAVTTDPGVQQMPSIAADPSDAKHLVIAYMDRSLVSTGYAGIGVAVSHDAGGTWAHTSVPLP